MGDIEIPHVYLYCKDTEYGVQPGCKERQLNLKLF